MSFRQFDITIEDLQIFLAVAECSSFSGAGKLLGKSQPSISNRVKSLEEKLQGQLILRGSKPLRLTKEGQRLQIYALKLADDMEALHDNFHEKGNSKKRSVRICSPIMTASVIIGDTIEQFQELNRDITIELVEDIPASCVQRVVDGDCEMAILADIELPEEAQFEPLLRDDCQAISAAGHPLTETKSVSISDVLKYPILCPDIHMRLREELQCEADKRDIEITFVPQAFGVTSYVTLLSMASSGKGVAIASTGLIPSLLKGIMHITDINDCKFVRTFGTVTAKNRKLSPAAKRFSEYLVKLGSKLELEIASRSM